MNSAVYFLHKSNVKLCISAGALSMTRSQYLKISIFILGVIAVVLCVLVSMYVANERCFESYADIPARIANADRLLKVGIIGDSWVAGKKLDQPVKESLLKSSIVAVIISSGQPNAKSRQVYRNLFLPRWKRYSSNAILMDDEMDFLVVVVAGVNDTAGHIGMDFYAHHMVAIAQAALDRSIIPIIVEIPEYGIEDTPADSAVSWAKRLLFRIIFDRGKVNVIEDYRRQLRSAVAACPDGHKITVLEFSLVASDYTSQKELFANPAHLNKIGSNLLGELIARKIREIRIPE